MTAKLAHRFRANKKSVWKSLDEAKTWMHEKRYEPARARPL